MDSQEIPEIVIGRLPIYLRALQHLDQNGQQVTSSHELGELLGISPPQIRKDLSQFGEFGKQGTGYHVSFLIKQLQKILNLEQIWDIAIIGAGDVGHALARYQGFVDRGFQVTKIFDNNPDIIGKTIGEYPILDIKEMETTIQDFGIKSSNASCPSSSSSGCDRLADQGRSKGNPKLCSNPDQYTK